MAVIDISALRTLEVCENVVTIPEVTDACPYEMIRIADWHGDKRYQCPACPNYNAVSYEEAGKCTAARVSVSCKIALARREGHTCPLGYRSPK